MPSLARAVSIEDLRVIARGRLPRAVFDFIDGGSGDEVTLRANRDGFQDWDLLPRVAVDVAERSMSTLLLGRAARLPLVLAPTGLAGLFWPKGEIAVASAAASAGIPFCLSTNSVASIEEVASAAPDADRWFQLYPLRDHGLMNSFVERAQGAGYTALCLTLDLPVQGRRERDVRNAFTVPYRPGPGAIVDLLRRPGFLLGMARAPVRFGNFSALPPGSVVSVAQHVGTLFDPAADWGTVEAVRKAWQGRFVLKGVLHPADAVRAVDAGAEAVVVSNHGGRQLDGVPAAIRALPAVAEAVAGRAEILLDGGVRRGTDILKALALGASACMIGRAFLWGLAAGGRSGVDRSLSMLGDELDNAMALLGTSSVGEVNRGHLVQGRTVRSRPLPALRSGSAL